MKIRFAEVDTEDFDFRHEMAPFSTWIKGSLKERGTISLNR